MNTQTLIHERTVKSYVCRGNRFSHSEKQALELIWPKFGVPYSKNLILDNQEFLKNSSRQKILEIGFGDGQSLIQMSENNPDKDFIGIEVFEKGIARLLLAIEKLQLNNLQIIKGDAALILEHMFEDHSLSSILVFFADPWPKTKHHKRRLIQTDFVEKVALKLKIGGIFHLATDCLDYAQHMMSVISRNVYFQNLAGLNQFSERPLSRPQTKYERRGILAGRLPKDLIFKRISL